MSSNAYTGDHSRDAASLKQALQQEGCALCLVLLEYMEREMDTWNYEGFTDVEHRFELIRTRGFCPLHTWQLAQRNNTFQLAVVYKEILTDILEKMSDADGTQAVLPRATSTGLMAEMKRWFQPDIQPTSSATFFAGCPLCRQRDQAEQRMVELFTELMRSEETQEMLRQSTGLCRFHFAQTTQYAREHKLTQQNALVECQRACLQRTLDEVQELIRKHDYRFIEETSGDEMTSWRRAAQLCAGNPGVR